MNKTNTYYISLDTVKKDMAHQGAKRGERKWVVTDLYETSEIIANVPEIHPPKANEKCPVVLSKDTEIAIFNQNAIQNRHFHKECTEIYLPIEGEIIIEVEDVEYRAKPGDMIVVTPNSAHEVINKGSKYLCRVISVNCNGSKDKFFAKSLNL